MPTSLLDTTWRKPRTETETQNRWVLGRSIVAWALTHAGGVRVIGVKPSMPK